MSWDELRRLYEEHLRALRRAPSTVRNANQHLRDFIAFCARELQLEEPQNLHRAHLLRYLAHLRTQPLTASTRYVRQRTLRTWLHWAAWRGHLWHDPCQGLAAPHPPLFPRGAATESQVRALLAAPPPDTWTGQRDRALFEFLYGTGLRAAECLAVDLPHLDLAARQVQVVNGKGGRDRVVPLGPRLAEVLARYLDQVRPAVDHAALWVSRRTRARLQPPRLGMIVLGYARPLGLAGFSPHSFRHAFATHLLARGAPLVALQRLLGHASLESTTRYTHLLALDLQEELRRTHPRAKRKKRVSS